MASLVRGEPGLSTDLNWFITVSGAKNDANEIGFRVIDITSGLPGVQVFPASGYHDVTSTAGHFATGSYYAYDSGESAGWGPTLSYNLGTHRIEWRWKLNASDPYQTGSEDFEVVAEATAPPTGTLYITVQDIRDEGLTSSVASDAKVLAYIKMWQQMIERATRQWFDARAVVLSLDGTDSDTLHLPVPIITCDYVKLNDDTTELSTSLYKVYNGRQLPDDRKNPRIKLVNEQALDIYIAPIFGRYLIFRKGRQNQEVSGTFGYIEPDGSTPDLIKRALTKLVVEKLAKPIYSSSGSTPTPPPPIVGNLLEELTDGHKRKYSSAGGEKKPRRPGLSGFTDDPEILDIIAMYKAPIGMAAPPNPSYR